MSAESPCGMRTRARRSHHRSWPHEPTRTPTCGSNGPRPSLRRFACSDSFCDVGTMFVLRENALMCDGADRPQHCPGDRGAYRSTPPKSGSRSPDVGASGDSSDARRFAGRGGNRVVSVSLERGPIAQLHQPLQGDCLCPSCVALMDTSTPRHRAETTNQGQWKVSRSSGPGQLGTGSSHRPAAEWVRKMEERPAWST